MESEVESIISPNPHNTKIYCNQVIVVETKCYQTEKLKSLYSGLSVHKHRCTNICYVIGHFSKENPINYKEDGLLYCIQLEKRILTPDIDTDETSLIPEFGSQTLFLSRSQSRTVRDFYSKLSENEMHHAETRIQALQAF